MKLHELATHVIPGTKYVGVYAKRAVEMPFDPDTDFIFGSLKGDGIPDHYEYFCGVAELNKYKDELDVLVEKIVIQGPATIPGLVWDDEEDDDIPF